MRISETHYLEKQHIPTPHLQLAFSMMGFSVISGFVLPIILSFSFTQVDIFEIPFLRLVNLCLQVWVLFSKEDLPERITCLNMGKTGIMDQAA